MAIDHSKRNWLVAETGLQSQPTAWNVMTCLPVVLFFIGVSNYAFGAVINAVGFNGTFLRSEDDGATWSLTTIYNRELLAVDFVDGDTGWVSGSFYLSGSNHRTVMRYTTNGGVSWRVADFPGQNLVLDLHFIDSNTGWFVAGGGKVGRTDDGGLTWAPQRSGANSDLFSVDFVDANQGWAVGSSGIVHTSNGGMDWTVQTRMGSLLLDVDFIDTNEGWAVGYGGVILHTSNGGIDWTTQNSGVNTYFRGIDFFNANRGWVVGANGIILGTLDGGMNWTPQSSGDDELLNDVEFMSPCVGWAVGERGTILHTIDGGSNWENQTSGTIQTLNAISVVPVLPATSTCNLDGDAGCDVFDINLMFEEGDLLEGVPVPSGDEKFDFVDNDVIDNDDVTHWLSNAAHENGFCPPYRRGDTNLDRDVDITDFNRLAMWFEPAGDGDATNGPFWHRGNFDGDDDIDITDFNFLAANFAETGYGASSTSIPEPAGVEISAIAVLALCCWRCSHIGRLSEERKHG